MKWSEREEEAVIPELSWKGPLLWGRHQTAGTGSPCCSGGSVTLPWPRVPGTLLFHSGSFCLLYPIVAEVLEIKLSGIGAFILGCRFHIESQKGIGLHYF